MKKKIAWGLAAFAVIVGLIMSGCAPAATPTTPTSKAPEVEKVSWRMTTTWSPAINLYYGEKHMIKYLKEMTGGNFVVDYYPAGALMPAFEVFDACSKGTVEMAGDWPSYWVSKDPAFDFLGSFPFGFTNMDYIIWLYQFGGLEMMQDLYGKYNMTYFSFGATPMESGFRTTEETGPIKTLEDYKGLKLRTPSRATIWILKQIGCSPVKIPGGEIYVAVERGVLDGAEFSSPGIDWEMGFQEITKYWSVPGWFQPASEIGVMVNLDAYNALSDKYKAILRHAAKSAAMESLAFWEADAARAVDKFKKAGTKIVHLDEATLNKLAELAGEYCIKQAKKSPAYAKILKSQMEYLKEYKDWRGMTEEFGFGTQPPYVDEVLKELEDMGY